MTALPSSFQGHLEGPPIPLWVASTPYPQATGLVETPPSLPQCPPPHPRPTLCTSLALEAFIASNSGSFSPVVYGL